MSVYKCEKCGNVVSFVDNKGPKIVCCGQEMTKLEVKTEDEGQEKHVPVISIEGNKVNVKVGSIEHPMEEEHFIQLIQLVQNDKVIFEKRLFAGEKPEAEFIVEDTNGIKARELCNMHGLWEGKNE